MAETGALKCGLLLVLLFSSFLALKGEEFELLLLFKASLTDPFRFLFNWNSSIALCSWYGVSCSNSSHVVGIDLSGKNFSGELPPSLFHLPSIQSINLSDNQLSGQIPEEIFSCFSLRYLNLSNNNFTGLIPSGSIPGLESLDLSNNMLSGEIPAGIHLFTGLKVLDLGGNVLKGKIPRSISDLQNLQFLTLASNQLVGEIPRELTRMRSLNWIYLGYNNLSGEIPKQIGDLAYLSHLDLVYNNLTGEIPPSLGNLSHLRYLFLYQNKLTGSIPRSIFNLRNLISLDLSDNILSGEISELIIQLQNLEILQLFSNNFTGKIPRAVTSLPRLRVLQLWSNRLSGEIPSDLGKRNNLTVLDLSTNHLTGEIPESLCSSGRLFKLILFSNLLGGKIPEGLSHCRSLQRVRLQNNHLSGELPMEFTTLPLVYYIDMSGNKLSGRIDQRKWDMPLLQMLNLAGNNFFGNLPISFGSDMLENLDLSGNSFSGSIPPSIGNLPELIELKLSDNHLSGPIPEELSLCKKMVILDLGRNQFIGPIPTALSDMPVLGELDLSENHLSGVIPSNLGKVESLVQVNISHNNFHGCLPTTGAFAAINASAVSGNDLCGGDVASGLPPCKTGKKPVRWLFITSLLAILVLLALSAYVGVFIRRRNELQLKTVGNENGIWDLQFFNSKASNSITIDDILSSSMKQENIISRGRNGTSYKGKSTLNDMQFIIKGMDDNYAIPPLFWAEIMELGKLRHSNIVNLIGFCRSEKSGFLIYEFIEGKSLRDVLPGLSWERRQRIVVRIAKALQFLHSRCSTCFVVGKLSPEKVIVDGKDEPHVRLCLPADVFGSTDPKVSLSSGYVAPETRDRKEYTEKSDIYCFGILLIEILTGEAPSDAEFGVHDSFVEWARYCYSDCHLDTWIDPMMKENALNYQNKIVETMNLALHCTAGDPSARPCTRDICKTLESATRSSSCISRMKLLTSI